MSLIQQALEKAKQPDKTPLPLKAAAKVKPEMVTPTISSKPEHEPRVSSIKFYETLQKEVEKDIKMAVPIKAPIQESKPEKKNTLSKSMAVWIGFLVAGSLLVSWFLFPQFQKQSMPASSIKSIVTASRGGDRFLLTGITAYATGNYALINNQVVAVGDRLPENTIVKSISSSAVILDRNGRDITLTL